MILVVLKKKTSILFFLIFTLLLFLRFYKLDESSFRWDQVNNAWAAQNIIVEHKFPLVGFQAKLNSGIYIGPIYYYLISIFYFFTNLDPIASGIFAGVTGIFTFFTIFFISKKLFSLNVAFIMVFLHVVSFHSIIFDRSQGPINFIPAISLIIFYSLYKIITGNPKFSLLFTAALGFSLHLHFTAIYFPIITLFCLPFFPRTKELLKYVILGVPIFLLFIFPSVIAFLQNSGYASAALGYGSSYFHGFHLTRIMQLTNDALIQFEPYFDYSNFKYLKFVLIPLFVFIFLYKNMSREKLLFCYLILLWFIVPWLVLSSYSGEISDYYFSANRLIALLIIAYLLSKVLELKVIIVKVAIVSFLIFYMLFNVNKFLYSKNNDLKERRQKVQQAIKEGKEIGFYEGSPDSYLYYYYVRKNGKKVY